MAAEGFQFEGVKYEMGNLMLAEARAVQGATGLTPQQFEEALAGYDAFAITALVWIGRRRHGEDKLRYEDVDGDLSTFRPYLETDEEMQALLEAAQAAAAGEGEAGKDDGEPALVDTIPAGTSSAEA